MFIPGTFHLVLGIVSIYLGVYTGYMSFGIGDSYHVPLCLNRVLVIWYWGYLLYTFVFIQGTFHLVLGIVSIYLCVYTG